MQVEQYWHESTLVDLILVIVKTLLFNLFHRFLHKIWNYSYFLILLKLILLKRAIIKWEILHYSILRVFFSMLIYSELFLTSQFYHNYNRHGVSMYMQLLWLQRESFVTREAPLRVQHSPFILQLAPCTRDGQMWWFTSGAVYSES